jgi:putative ABC transport system permease protein
MFDRDNWQEIFATIKKNKLRTFLTAFGVFWGIFMLVIMLGSGAGLRNGVLKDFEGTATNSFFVWSQKTSKPYKGMKPGRQFNFNTADIIALQTQVSEIDVVAPQNQLGGHDESNNVIRGLKSGVFSVYGQYPVINKIQPVAITRGRFLNDNDIANKRKVAVIGKRVVEVLFKKGETVIGEYISINGIYFQVIGVSKPTGSGENAQEQAQNILVPFTTFQHTFNNGDRVGWFAITAKKGIPASQAEEKAMALLRERHKVAPEDLLAIGHWNMEQEFSKLNGLFNGIDGLVWFVGIGTLIAGVIGVSNIMLIIVKERTKEIGVKRALGATPFMIVAQLIKESVFLTSFAGYFGLVAGIAVLDLVSKSLPPDDTGMFQNPEVNLRVAVTALVVLIVSGALAGMIPARKAVSINPVEALRSE